MEQELGVILLVDDNHDDYEATLRSLRKNRLMNPVHWCKSGADAKDYLYKQGKYEDDETVHRPCLMLLDLNMPGLDGRQLLKELKTDLNMASIPTIILSTSNNPKDVEECYSLGASTYIQKPVEFEGLTKAIKTMTDYWFGIALLPSKDRKP